MRFSETNVRLGLFDTIIIILLQTTWLRADCCKSNQILLLMMIGDTLLVAWGCILSHWWWTEVCVRPCAYACRCPGAVKVFRRVLTVETTPPPAALHPSTQSTSSLCAASNARVFSTRWRTLWRTARRGALSRRCAARESRCWPAERTVGVFSTGMWTY